jgi:hypothetical protein
MKIAKSGQWAAYFSQFVPLGVFFKKGYELEHKVCRILTFDWLLHPDMGKKKPLKFTEFEGACLAFGASWLCATF